ncbi:MAG TPA: hypothetical protein VF339_01110 [Gammaproteobacteria bacterium]
MKAKLVWAVAGAVAGCAASAQEVGTRLPNGVTLLGADSAPCADVLMIEPSGGGEDDAPDLRDDDVARVREGQFVVLEVTDPNVGWVCLGDPTRSDTMECPSETTHVRISRNIDEDVVLFECFGR